MANGVRFKDRLKGASNFVSWKFKIVPTLREHELEAFVENEMAMPKDDREKKSMDKEQ